MLKRENYQLRKLTEKDLPTILEWRNSHRIRASMYTDHIISWKEHVAWFDRIQQKKDMSYHICEYCQQPIGVIYFTNIDRENQKSFWGFYLGETNSPRGSGVIMEFLALEHAFEELKIRKLSCEVLEFNTSVIKLHKKFGFQEEGRFIEHIFKNEQYSNVVFLSLFDRTWIENKERYAKLAFKL
jgi:UDP-4-amino-4,6-dideoxy-N-acetyl-beta-L-altrosamine N-acetyltransferase